LGIIINKDNLSKRLVDCTRIGDFTWKVSDCEELVGYCAYDEVHVHYTHARGRISYWNYIYLIIIVISTARKNHYTHAGGKCWKSASLY